MVARPPLSASPDGCRLELSWTVETAPEHAVSVVLAARSGLSRRRIKDAMAKGAVWLTRRARRRLRRASARASPGDLVEMFYDDAVLAREPPAGRCIADAAGYSVWWKPAHLLSEGTDYGDHCSLRRQVEIHEPFRPVHVVHRLAAETAGLMLFAHTSRQATALGALFAVGDIDVAPDRLAFVCPVARRSVEFVVPAR